jgi:NAD(P)-dependent dehydrogenase (short-subunit alcohol dehydrogenase family)
VTTSELAGKVVLLTGGSTGIGAAAVRSLREAGANIFFTFLSHDAETDALVNELGDRVAARRCDLAAHDDLPSLVEECVARFGRLDVLVNNAANYSDNPFTGSDYAAWRAGWQRTFDVNVFGAAHLCWLAMRQMRAQGGGGIIINIASRAAHRGELTAADYGASKAALVNLTKSIARSCARDDIVAVAIAPGFIETDMAARDLTQRRLEIEAEIPIGYVGSADDVARVITFLASSRSRYLNGATIDVNGGSYVR